MHESAIQEGIQTIGTGKKASSDCNTELIASLIQEIKMGKVDEIALGAFLGALWMKGATIQEHDLEKAFKQPVVSNVAAAVQWALAGRMSEDLRAQLLLKELLTKKIFSQPEAEELGLYLFDPDFPARAKAMVASALRVRYSEPVEYYGLARAIEKRYSEPFRPLSQQVRRQLIQLADPFDGLERSESITPLIAADLTQLGFRVVQMVGQSSGPKFGVNGLQIGEALGLPKITSQKAADETDFSALPMGAILDQRDLSEELAAWVPLRIKIMKRPFLATLERFLNPLRAEYLFVSAFHGTFTEKMVDLAELMGFEKIAVLFKSLEGQLGLSLGRATTVELSIKQRDGSYKRFEKSFTPQSLGFPVIADPRLGPPSLEENCKNIASYLKSGSQEESYFATRTRYTLAVYHQILRELNS